MALARTHYDTLSVASDAPAEVVRAAYRVLAQKYHPDRNHGDAASATVMALVNEAYRVLRDPELRRQYDLWLRSAEAARNNEDIFAGARSTGSTPGTSQRRDTAAENPEAPHTRNVRGCRSVDLDQMWERWFNPSVRSRPAVGESEKPHTDDVLGSRTVDLDLLWDDFCSLFKRTRN